MDTSFEKSNDHVIFEDREKLVDYFEGLPI